MDTVTAVGHALSDPVGYVLHAVIGMLASVVDGARNAVGGILDRFLLATVDPTTGRALTSNPTVAGLNHGFTLAVDGLMTVVVLLASLRSMFERSLHAKYALKVIIPRVLLALVLAHGSLFLIQLAVDLNNAIGAFALSLGGVPNPDTMPWSATLAPARLARLTATQDLFDALMAIAVVAALLILVLAYVVRTALLNVLLVTAPLAALLTVIPDTRGHAHAWLHLFTGALFMQAVQVIVLRIALSTAFDSSGGLLSTIYALATLWLMLKVPGALGVAGHLESRAHTSLRSLEHHARRAIAPGHIVHRTAG